MNKLFKFSKYLPTKHLLNTKRRKNTVEKSDRHHPNQVIWTNLTRMGQIEIVSHVRTQWEFSITSVILVPRSWPESNYEIHQTYPIWGTFYKLNGLWSPSQVPSPSKTEEPFQTERHWREGQLNAMCFLTDPFAVKTTAGAGGKTWVGPED